MPSKKSRTPATEVRANLVTAGRLLLERDGAAALTVRLAFDWAQLKPGDRVLIRNTGAYTSTYSSVCFNGFPPLDVVIL